MAQSVHGTEVLIKSVFALQVAIRSTEGAEAICNKNQLGFTELLKPFSQLSSPGESVVLEPDPLRRECGRVWARAHIWFVPRSEY